MNYLNKFELDGHILYHADAKDIIPFIDKVDLFLSDVPYELTSGGKNTGQMGGIFSKENYNNSGKIVDCNLSWQEITDLAYLSLKDRSHAYIMSDNKNLRDMMNAAHETGFDYHGLLVWKKTNTIPNKYYMKNCEYTGFFKKGNAKTINNPSSQMCEEFGNPKSTKHPTEKPVELMKYYILNSTHEGDVVIDPFMGSGTTGIACVQTNRKFIGIELDKEYFEMSCKRLSNSIEQKNKMESIYG